MINFFLSYYKSLILGSHVVSIGADSLWDQNKSRRSKPGKRVGRPAKLSLSKLPTHVKALFDQAQDSFISGDHETAIRLLTDMIKVTPKLPELYELLALIHEEAGDLQKALEIYTTLSHLNKSNKFNNLNKMIQLAYDTNNYNEARYMHLCTIFFKLLFVN